MDVWMSVGEKAAVVGGDAASACDLFTFSSGARGRLQERDGKYQTNH